MNKTNVTSPFIGIQLRAKHLKRWNLMGCVEPELLSTHIYETSIIAHMLGMIAKTIFNESICPDKVCAMAVFHESGETACGIDAPTPVKYRNEHALAMFKNLESEFEQDLLESLPSELQSAYQDLIKQDKNEPHAAMAKAADKITHLLKCKNEVLKHNYEFKEALKNAETLVEDLRKKIPSVDYFCEVFFPKMSVSLDEQRIASNWIETATLKKVGG